MLKKAIKSLSKTNNTKLVFIVIQNTLNNFQQIIHYVIKMYFWCILSVMYFPKISPQSTKLVVQRAGN